MNTNEKTNSVNNSSALGNISVLTPSQRREQERLRKEKEEKEAAKAAKKAESARKAKETAQRNAKKKAHSIRMTKIFWNTFGILLTAIIVGILARLAYWAIEHEMFFLVLIVGIPVGIFCLWFIWALVISIKESRIKKVQSR